MASLIITYEITRENISHEARQTIPKWGYGVDSPGVFFSAAPGELPARRRRGLRAGVRGGFRKQICGGMRTGSRERFAEGVRGALETIGF